MGHGARTVGMLAAAGIVGAAVALGAASALGALGHSTTTVQEIAAPAEAASFAHSSAPLTIHDIYMRNAPGVVQVAAKTFGSGFVLDKAGHIVTNDDVVEGANRVEVSFSNREQLPARIVGRDPSTDLAVVQVRVSSRALWPLTIGDSDLVRVGDSVTAIGNPFGKDRSITSGIVSAIDHAIRTDATIGPGDSGGPLLNARGQVIGVTSHDFAVPSNTLLSVVAQLIAKGTVVHPFIGVQTHAITPAAASLFHLPVSSGLLVSNVCPSTGAASAGLRAATRQVTVAGESWPVGGDIIVAADGVHLGSVDALRQIVAQKRPGDTVQLRVLRGTRHLTLNVKLGRQPQTSRC